MMSSWIAWVRERIEFLIWGSRWLLMVAVIMAPIMATAAVVAATLEAVSGLRLLWNHEGGGHSGVISAAVKALDGYLLAAILLMFSVGLYSIFFGRIVEIPRHKAAGLVISSIDDLKHKLTQAILLILFVKFMDVVMEMTFVSAIDVVWLGLGTALISLSLVVSRTDHSLKKAVQLFGSDDST